MFVGEYITTSTSYTVYNAQNYLNTFLIFFSTVVSFPKT